MSTLLFLISIALLSQLSITGVHGAAGDLDDVCNNGGCKDTNHVCDVHLQTPNCKIKSGENCTLNGTSCVDGATCNTTTDLCVCGSNTNENTITKLCELDVAANCSSNALLCKDGTTCEIDICKLDVAANCSSNALLCKDGTTCENDICKLNMGGNCSSTNSGNCKMGLVCGASGSTCGIPIGGNCTANSTNECVTGAMTCSATSPVCACPSTHVPNADNTGCSVKSGGGGESGAGGKGGIGVTATLLLFVLTLVTTHLG